MVIWFLILAIFMCLNTLWMVKMAYESKDWGFVLLAILFGITSLGLFYVGAYFEWVGPAYKYVGGI